jgi:hypothetical protein
MKTISKILLVLALVAVPFLTLSTPAQAQVAVGVSFGPGYYHHHHHHYYHHHYHHWR